MVRLGRVYENWMVYVALTNQKLRHRGARILQEAAGVSVSAAEQALRQSQHNLPVALIMLKIGLSVRDARQRLQQSGGNVRQALESRAKTYSSAPGKRK